MKSALKLANRRVAQEASKDAAVVTVLLPGSYTVQVSGLDRTSTGLALVEVYDLP